MSMTMQNSTVRAPATTPFRTAAKAVRTNRRSITVRAAQEPAEVAKKAGAAFAAAALALAPLSATAAENRLQVSVGSPEQLQDKAAAAAKETAKTIKRNVDPRNADPSIAGNALREAGKNAVPDKLNQGRGKPVAAPALYDRGLQVSVGTAESLQGKAAAAAKETANTVKKNADPRNLDTSIAGDALRTAGKNANPKKVSFGGSGGGLQRSVGIESLPQKVQDGAEGAAKSSAGFVSKSFQNPDPRIPGGAGAGKAGDALRDAGKAAKNAMPAAFAPAAGLQVNVSAEKLADKAAAAAKETANTVKRNVDPRNIDTSRAGNAVREAGKNAIPDGLNQGRGRATPTAFTPAAAGLQVNVSNADKLQDKAAAAAKETANTVKRNVDPRNIDTSIAGNAVREAGKNANPTKLDKPASFRAGGPLQVSVGFGQAKDQAAETAAEGVKAATRGAEWLAKADFNNARKEAETSAGQKGGPDPAAVSEDLVNRGSAGVQGLADKAKDKVQGN